LQLAAAQLHAGCITLLLTNGVSRHARESHMPNIRWLDVDTRRCKKKKKRTIFV
jgi:hypothetical protein